MFIQLVKSNKVPPRVPVSKCPLSPHLLDRNSPTKVQLAFLVIGRYKKRSEESFQEHNTREVSLQRVESGKVSFRMPTTVRGESPWLTLYYIYSQIQ